MSQTDDNGRTPRQRVLVVDDDMTVCLSCSRILEAEGHEVACRQNPVEGLEAARSGDYDVILLDLLMPEMDGLEVLQRLRSDGNRTEVVVITGYSTVQSAVEAMKLGAADFISKPFTPDELLLGLRKVFERSALIRENARLRRELEEHRGFQGIIAGSRPMERLFDLVRRVAPTQGTVLITGESGTGKEMVAQAVHRLSPRAGKPFVACDCSSLAPTLLESELFGHVKGSFSGAVSTKQGLFDFADGGTLFLDEVANLSLEIQGKLLRVLETRKLRRVGDAAEHEVDIRLIAATNRALKDLVGEGNFREDLFYRLNVVPLSVPPLRERHEDIPLLAMVLLERVRKANPGTKVLGFTPEAMRALEGHSWPGNVRELKNMIERLAILTDAERIEPAHLPPELAQGSPARSAVALPEDWEAFKTLKRQLRDEATDELEHRFLSEALLRSGGNVTKAAEAVGMQRSAFHALMRKHRIVSRDGS